MLWRLIALLTLLVTTQSSAQQVAFRSASVDDPVELSRAMAALASKVVAVYREKDREIYLDNLFRLQMVARRYADSEQTIAQLHALRLNRSHASAAASNVQFGIFAHAKVAEARGEPFAQAFQSAFRASFRELDARTSAMVIRMFNAEDAGGLSLILDRTALRRKIESELDRQSDRSTISLSDALRLARDYQIEDTYRSFMPLIPMLVAEDDRRRYIVDADIKVKTPDGATICVLTVRPRAATGRLTTLFEFTIYADRLVSMSEARRVASNGFAGVVGFTRGKACSSDEPVPYEHDGDDSRTVIDWISQQSWSDGRVGMFGGSYSGFTQWATAKRLPVALKAIMTGVTAAPGIGSPMEGGVVQSAFYYWPLYTSVGHELDVAAFEDSGRWSRVFRSWYRSGKAYRALEAIDGTPNPFWTRWMNHPTYDEYWQKMSPTGPEFARINIPVLTTTGYYDGGQISALYYFMQHHRNRMDAEHYLVIGPYDHGTGNRGTVGLLGDQRGTLEGYQLDHEALIDLGELRFEWFDYVFRGAPKPALLSGVVNYEVMGANMWKHASSIDAMHDRQVTLHLSGERHGLGYRLSDAPPPAKTSVLQTVDLADRSDVDRESFASAIVSKVIDTTNAVEFFSDPLAKATEFSGLFSAQLSFVTNKRDFDFNLQIYELTSAGEYMRLSWYLGRASHVTDPTRRHLLVPNEPQRLAIVSGRLISRQIQPESRLVLVIRICKEPGKQVNYGTGKPVSDETIADAGTPLSVRWLGDSFIGFPLH